MQYSVTETISLSSAFHNVSLCILKICHSDISDFYAGKELWYHSLGLLLPRLFQYPLKLFDSLLLFNPLDKPT